MIVIFLSVDVCIGEFVEYLMFHFVLKEKQLC